MQAKKERMSPILGADMGLPFEIAVFGREVRTETAASLVAQL
jgi:hypothetical protein